MEKLISELKGLINEFNNKNGYHKDLDDNVLDKLYSVYPFNKFEYVISRLISSKIIDFNDYLKLRNSYLERNKYL